jgi:hypothetical protein
MLGITNFDISYLKKPEHCRANYFFSSLLYQSQGHHCTKKADPSNLRRQALTFQSRAGSIRIGGPRF